MDEKPRNESTGQQNQGQYKVQMDYYMVEEKVAQEPQNTYMLFSTLNIFFCCLFMGIVSCIYSFRTRYSNSQGDYAQAHKDSRCALGWNVITLVCGIVIGFVLTMAILTHQGWTIQAFNDYIICKRNPALEMCEEEK